jgi:hypothetical protein
LLLRRLDVSSEAAYTVRKLVNEHDERKIVDLRHTFKESKSSKSAVTAMRFFLSPRFCWKLSTAAALLRTSAITVLEGFSDQSLAKANYPPVSISEQAYLGHSVLFLEKAEN